MAITAGDLVHREVLCCVSSLVSTLAEGATAPESHNAAGTVLADLAWQALDLASPVPDYEEAAIQAGWTRTPEGWWWREPEDGEEADFYFLGSGPFVRADTLEEACEHDGLDPIDRDVYGHWAVADWLADQLEAHGEKVDRDFAGLTVWARTTTGQMIAADSIIEAIAAELNAGAEG